MAKAHTQTTEEMQLETVTFLSLGGEEDVTRNMYLYEYKDQILIVDCGLGFPDETMLGVDLLLPDITYLLQNSMPEGKAKKKIVGMLLTHGHEDHIGGLPYILPQLPSFPLYGSPLTAALANEKLTEFHTQPLVQAVPFTPGTLQIGDFNITFIHVTHSIPDAAHLFIETPVGNFYHGADYKFDLTPADQKRTEFLKIAQAAQKGITALLSDCLGAERPGFTPSEEMLTQNFEKAMRDYQGKVFITTNSSNVSRLNQAIEAAEKLNRKVCFVGRSIFKAKRIAQKLGYLHIKRGTEIQIDQIPHSKSNQIFLIENGQEVVFTDQQAKIGKKIEVKKVYVDEVSGEELESYVIRDRERLAQEGVLILLVEINASNSQLARKPEVITRGTSLSESKEDLAKILQKEIAKALSNQKGTLKNRVYVRRIVGDVAERYIFKKFHSQPLVLPVVIEV